MRERDYVVRNLVHAVYVSVRHTPYAVQEWMNNWVYLYHALPYIQVHHVCQRYFQIDPPTLVALVVLLNLHPASLYKYMNTYYQSYGNLTILIYLVYILHHAYFVFDVRAFS